MGISTATAGRAASGEHLTLADLEELAASDVLELGMLADEARRTRVGATVTYARVFEWSEGADGAGIGHAGEVRLGPLPGGLDQALAEAARARQAAGTALLTASLAGIAARGWGPLAHVLGRFKSAGLDAIADVAVDPLAGVSETLLACRDAGLPVRCLSVAKPLGATRLALMADLHAIVAQFPDIRTFAPLSREQSVAVPTTGYDDVRAVALARLALPTLPVIQVDWAQYGPKLAQVALTFGANDLDRVSPADDDSLGRRRAAVEDVRRNIEAAGFTPVERDARA